MKRGAGMSTDTKSARDIELAIRAQVVLSLAEISDQRKTLCHFDEATRKVTDGLGQDLSPMVYGSATAI